MKAAEIHYFESRRVHGHDSRDKYHIYLGPSDWRDETSGHSFLFISKSGYECDYEILKSDYNFFPLERSYVTCSSIVTYTEKELGDERLSMLATLKKEHIKELYDALLASDVMEQWQQQFACNCLINLL